MDRDQLESFVVLSKTGSFTKTSELLHVVQSTITTRMKALESQIGKKLLDRGTRFVRLTPAGSVFLSHARKILEQMDTAVAETRLQDKYDYRITIGGLNSVWEHSDFYQLIEKIAAGETRIAVRIVTDHSTHLINQLQSGTIDAAFVYQKPRAAIFETIPFREDRIILVGHPEFCADMSELSSIKFPYNHFLYYNWGTAYEEWFHHEFGQNFPQPLRVDHAGLALRLLTEHHYLGFILEGVATHLIQNGTLKVLNYQAKSPIPSKWIYLVYLKNRTKEQNLKAFLADFLLNNINIKPSGSFQ